MKSYFFVEVNQRTNNNVHRERIDAKYDGKELDIKKQNNGNIEHYKLDKKDVQELLKREPHKQSILERLQNDFKVKRKNKKKTKKSTKKREKKVKSNKKTKRR